MTKRLMGPKTLLFPMPAVLVGTYAEDGRADAMTAAWAAACCHAPPCVGVAVRRSRLTFANLEARGAFTLNVARADKAVAVDYLGIVSGREVPDKLARAGFEAVAATKVDAPILPGCPVNLECRVVGRLPLGSHTWFVGEVVEAHVDEELLTEDGKVRVDALDPLVFCTSSQDYHRLAGPVARAFSAGRALER